MQNKTLILHLSDIHIKTKSDLILQEAKNIACTLNEYLPKNDMLLILISGDIAFSGTQEQYNYAHTFIDEIVEYIKSQKPNIKIHVIVTAGNHDLDFSNENSIRPFLLEQLKKDPSLFNKDDIKSNILEPQRNYLQFEQDIHDYYNSNLTRSGDELYKRYEINCLNFQLNIRTVNVACCSERKEKIGDLIFPIDTYLDDFINESDSIFNITLHHQPAHWHTYNSYTSLREILKNYSDLILTGHEHISNMGEIFDTETGTDSSYFIEAGTLQEKSDNIDSSSFNILCFENKVSLSIFEYERIENKYKQKSKQQYFLDQRKKHTPKFKLKDEFINKINDVGGYFKHHSREKIYLEDIYIYPQVKDNSVSNNNSVRGESSNQINSSEIFIDMLLNSASSFLILGDEKYGKTCLLHMMYKKLFSKNVLPILIDGEHIKKKTNIEKLIKSTYEEQYNTDWDEYTQEDKNKKILLLDNIDLSTDSDEKITELKLYFDSIVMTANTLFESKRIIEANIDSPLMDFKYYTLFPFGHVLREKLISKWINLGIYDSNNQISKQDILQRCVEAQNQIDTVLGTGVVPSIPLYLLTLLQTFESTATSLNADSSLGHYYHALITIALDRIGKSKETTEFFDYLVELSWFVHKKSPKNLSYQDLQQFNIYYSNNWNTVDFEKRLNDLIKARIIEKDIYDEYNFKYPYIYHFLHGKYLSEHLDDKHIYEYVQYCCRHLYIRKYANTVLFLAHHTKSLKFMNILQKTLTDTLKTYDPVKFNKDTGHISQFVQSSNLMIENNKIAPEQNRTEMNQQLDDFKNHNNIEDDKEEELDELNVIAEINVLFKTTEIIGQILKNQYSSIKRDTKEQLLKEVIEGMLRGLQCFYNTLIEDPSALINELEQAINKKAQQNEIKAREFAEGFVSHFIKLISTGMIVKAITNINSKKLQEFIQSIQTDDNNAQELIKIGTQLDSFGKIPFDSLSDLFLKIKGENIATNILYFLILRRVYLFPVNSADIQRLNTIFKFDDTKLKQITYLNKQTKLLDK